MTRAVERGLLPVPLQKREQTSVGPWAERRFRNTRVAFMDAGADQRADILAYVGDFDPLAERRITFELVRVTPEQPMPEVDSGKRLDPFLGSDVDAEELAARYYFAEAGMGARAQLLAPAMRAALQALSPAVLSVAALDSGGVCMGIDLEAASRAQLRADLRQATAMLSALESAPAAADRSASQEALGPAAPSVAPPAEGRHADATAIAVARLHTNRVAEPARRAIEDAIALGIRTSARHDALAYRDLASILGEQVAQQVAACAARDSRCATRALRATPVPYLLGGSLSKQGSRVQAHLSLIEVSSGRVLKREVVRGRLAGAEYELAFRSAASELVSATDDVATAGAAQSKGAGPEEVVGAAPTALGERVARLWRGTSYAIDAQVHSQPPRLAELLHSPPVSVDARGRPVDELLEDISRHSGIHLRWDDGDSKASEPPSEGAPSVSIRATNAPPLALVAALCQRHGWDLVPQDDDRGRTFTVRRSSRRVLAHLSEGPLTLLWYGSGSGSGSDAGARSRANVEGRQGRAKATTYVFAVLPDPNSHVVALRTAPLTGQTAAITPARGRRVISASLAPHRSDPAVASLSGLWTARTRKALRVERAHVGITIPFAAPTVLEHAVLRWEKGARARAARPTAKKDKDRKDAPGGAVEVSVQEVASRHVAATQSVTTIEHVVVLRLEHAADGAWTPSMDHPETAQRHPLERKRPRQSGRSRRGRADERRGAGNTDVVGLVTPVEARVMTASGGLLRASTAVSEERDASVRTYRVVITCRTDDPGLRPERIRVSWAVGYREVQEGLLLTDVPMHQPLAAVP